MSRVYPSLDLTVVLPAHNAEATIAQAIASTLQQSYTDFELWVLENGSRDRTAEIARGFTDPRVKVFELGSVGFQGALQYAIENASSEWLARMDADDLMFPDRLKVQMELVRERPEVVLVGTASALLTPFGHIFERYGSWHSREVDTVSMCWNRFFADPSTVFRRRVALEVGGVDPEFTIGDVPLWFRLLSAGKGWEIAEPLHLYRIQQNSMSQGMEFYRQAIRAREKYAPQAVSHWPDPPGPGNDHGSWVVNLEAFAGDGATVRQAVDRLGGDAPPSARRLRWLTYLGQIGYLGYRLRYRPNCRYRHRPDWERMFGPLLGTSPRSMTVTVAAGI